MVETPHLRSWFYSPEPLPRAQRQTEFIHMAHQMRTAREDPELVSAVAMLAYREIYEAVLAGVRQRASETSRDA